MRVRDSDSKRPIIVGSSAGDARKEEEVEEGEIVVEGEVVEERQRQKRSHEREKREEMRDTDLTERKSTASTIRRGEERKQRGRERREYREMEMRTPIEGERAGIQNMHENKKRGRLDAGTHRDREREEENSAQGVRRFEESKEGGENRMSCVHMLCGGWCGVMPGPSDRCMFSHDLSNVTPDKFIQAYRSRYQTTPKHSFVQQRLGSIQKWREMEEENGSRRDEKEKERLRLQENEKLRREEKEKERKKQNEQRRRDDEEDRQRIRWERVHTETRKRKSVEEDEKRDRQACLCGDRESKKTEEEEGVKKETEKLFKETQKKKKRKRIFCTHLLRKGWCTFGKRCHYRHDFKLATISEIQQSFLMRLGETITEQQIARLLRTLPKRQRRRGGENSKGGSDTEEESTEEHRDKQRDSDDDTGRDKNTYRESSKSERNTRGMEDRQRHGMNRNNERQRGRGRGQRSGRGRETCPIQ